MANATTAGVICTLNGKEYEFAPLDLEDLEWLELWVRTQAIRVGRASLPDNVSPADEERYMRPIIDGANRISLMGSDGFKHLSSPSSFIRVIHRMVQHKHPEVTIQDCVAWTKDGGEIENLTPIIQLIAGAATGTPVNTNGESLKKVKGRKKHSTER